MNLQPSEAEAGFDIRVPPTADGESLERRIAEEWAPVTRNMTFEVRKPVVPFLCSAVDHLKNLRLEPNRFTSCRMTVSFVITS